mmetsp:Transcript_8476/g.12322  ORF Transcript_8476/g.12322 Transcript_8476/m.12322 type:complete len:182 (-) Transcript_8476:356-901(-)|eukprot:CAMPEP_0195520056 /NCGR_PEP_ID=MMETSP0794_2-20130614/16006_1 /TAXON_ID=515487 /ORGANISM="Stephanopyxis turris, Strain CCMP 815" /LENGTH=181 /DNA_ID=CAMNT_0040649327 /DNA_START=127 /DNA_END=672 /DNA_ORIENTATION=-
MSKDRQRALFRYPTFVAVLFVYYLCLTQICHATADNNNQLEMSKAKGAVKRFISDVSSPIVEKYEDLPPKGKFATGAFVGITTTRYAVKTAVGVMKLTAAAFLISEALSFAGLTKVDLSEENEQIVKHIKNSVMQGVEDCRVKIRVHLNPEKIRSRIAEGVEHDKYGSAGLVVGATAGLLI